MSTLNTRRLGGLGMTRKDGLIISKLVTTKCDFVSGLQFFSPILAVVPGRHNVKHTCSIRPCWMMGPSFSVS